MWRRRKDGRTGALGAFLDESSELEGKYTCGGTVMLDAKFRGDITARDTLIIGKHGVVDAQVRGAKVVVRGKVTGTIVASERVDLKDGARVTGDVEAPVITMEEGAYLDGRCKMTAAKPGEKPAEPSLSIVVPIKA